MCVICKYNVVWYMYTYVLYRFCIGIVEYLDSISLFFNISADLNLKIIEKIKPPLDNLKNRIKLFNL